MKTWKSPVSLDGSLLVISRRHHPVHVEAAAPLEAHVQHGVVLVVLAHPGTVVKHLDAVLLQLRRRSDAGEHHDVGAVKRARGKHHLGADRSVPAAVLLVVHPGHAVARQGKRNHRSLGDDGEVGPAPGGLQIGYRGGLPHAVLDVVRRRAQAPGIRVVHVALRQPEFPRRVHEYLHGSGDILAEEVVALEVERPAVAVVGTVRVVLVVLEPLQDRQDVFPRPVGVAGRRPRVHVRLDRTDHRHHVHRGTAPHDLTRQGIKGAAVDPALARVHVDVGRLQEQPHPPGGLRHQLGDRQRIGAGLQQ